MSKISIQIPPELQEKLEEMEKLASRNGRCESNVQIMYMGYAHKNPGGQWGFMYDGDFQGPYNWEDLEEKIQQYCQ